MWCSGAAEADTGPFCVPEDRERLAVLLCPPLGADGVVPGARLSMKANIAGHKDVLQAGDRLSQEGGVALKFLHHNRQDYASTCSTTYTFHSRVMN